MRASPSREAIFLSVSQLGQGDSSCILEITSPYIPKPKASPAPSRCSINILFFSLSSLLLWAVLQPAQSEKSGFSAPLQLLYTVFLKSLFQSRTTLFKLSPTRDFSSAVELLVPLPLQQPLMGFDEALRSQTQNLVFRGPTGRLWEQE